MGSHICSDCGDQVVAAPGVVHHCRVREERAYQVEVDAQREEIRLRAAWVMVRQLAERTAEAISDAGFHVSVLIFEPYGVDDPQPDPTVDVWRSAIPVDRGHS